ANSSISLTKTCIEVSLGAPDEKQVSVEDYQYDGGFLAPFFGRLASYNRRANHLLLDNYRRLKDDEINAPRPAFFGSILATLNHILVGDQAWLARLHGDPPPGRALDHILCHTLSALITARELQDDEITAYVKGLTELEFAATIRYQNMSGVDFENSVSVVLTHMFNHQTHHRGQVHDMLSQTSVPPPELDFIFFIREASAS
ncbi:MAG TPA: hypothetical protein EYQ81_15965, partial [Sneathiellales bacterium]|nr:hypothetical protein [Sneathiellales bacterium]